MLAPIGAVRAVEAELPATEIPIATRDLPSDRYIVAFYKDPFLKPGDRYMGEPVVAVDHDLIYIIVRTKTPDLFAARVSLDDNVRYLQWDDPHYGSIDLVPNDAKYSDAGHWGSKKIGAEAAWDRTLGSTAVKVAMIDSGLNKNHEDITGSRVLAGYDYHNGDADPNDESGCSWHGTHTTGTAGATINNAKGIAGISQHTILPFKGLGASALGCTGSTSGLANALKAAGDQGAHISSNSWGGGGVNSALNDAIQYAHDRGVIHVAAAGNSGPCTNCVGEPWKSKASVVIIVASTTETDGQSSFSSEGAEIDVSAPGSNILSTTSGTSTYGSLSGTSMATPHVAGVAALLKAQNSGWAFADVDTRLKNTAVDLGPAGHDHDFGFGRINADAATAGSGGCTGTAPAAPTLSATAGSGQVSLSWTDGSNGGCAITGHSVYRSTTSGAQTLLATIGTNTTYVDYAVTAGTTYYYKVTATNSIGESPRSNEASATPTAPACPGPANNCFASPTSVTAGGATVSQSTSGATLETNEPRPCGTIGATVWFTWTPTTSGTATIETSGSNYDTVVAAYTGSSLTALTNVACNDDISGTNLQSRISFTASAGTTYRIQAGGYNSATGSLTLKVTAPTCGGQPNDCFSNSIVISARPYTNTQSTSGATLETNEPRPCGSIGATVWYSWTPSVSGTFTVDTRGSNFDTVLAIYTGSSVGGLTNLNCNDDISSNDYDSTITRSFTAGTTYRIQAGGYNGATGSTLKLNIN